MRGFGWAVVASCLLGGVATAQDLFLEGGFEDSFVVVNDFAVGDFTEVEPVPEPVPWTAGAEPVMMAPGFAQPMLPPDYGPLPRRSCPPWRPCGPNPSWGSNWLFYQGAHGVDFRPACQNHDDCLMNPYNSRYGCDRAFYEQISATCANSPNPALCQWKATKYYIGVRLFGGFVRTGAP